MNSASNTEGSEPFAVTWGYPSEVKTALGASWYEVVPSLNTYASGRPKLTVRFFGAGYGANRALIAERDGMELSSKRTGDLYVVCKRLATPQKTQRPPGPIKMSRAHVGSPLDASVIFNDDDEVPPQISILKRSTSFAP